MEFTLETLFSRGPLPYGQNLGGFPNPFFDIASQYIPHDIKTVFKMCEYIYFVNGGIVKSATERIIQYFVTDIKYEETDDNAKKIQEALEEELHIKSLLLNIGRDYLVYGNSIVAVYFPFARFLECPNCKTLFNSSKLEYFYKEKEFRGTCPNCLERNIKFKVKEEKKKDIKKIKVLRLDPKTLIIKSHPLSQNIEYYWEIPENLKNGVKENDKFYIDDTPAEFLEAIHDDKLFKWDPKFVFHIKAPTIAGFPFEWGCPHFLHILKLNFYLNVLRRANEAIALDYIVPFRVISPAANSGNMDPIKQYNLRSFVSHINTLIERHRIDPCTIQVSPIPIAYQSFGGEGKALDVTPEIRALQEEILHTLNYPADLFYGNLRIQSLPVSLRIFENAWRELVEGLNNILQWLVNHICDYMRWERQKIKLTPVTLADDIEKRNVLLNLASAHQVSMIEALKAYGLDFREQQRLMMQEQKIVEELQNEYMAEQQAKMQAGETEGAGQEATPMDINSQAQMLAQQLLAMPYEARRAQLRQLEQMNPTLYALTKTVMEKIRNVARTQQGYQTLAAMGMPGAMMPPSEEQQ